ncbi:hypothetical protein EBH_0070960 [Eimeria brunetti]|uniref:Uncharacterized protein n=1 Tax=Eimeria brunetti TaxID=51314 RepID=U6LZM5_9EIME|nr:hypothetical protein EBH_0070960 [Eimeria brunetti]
MQDYQVETKGARFFCCSEEHLEPKPYLQQQLPELLPRRLSPEEAEAAAAAATEIALKGYCPVTLVRTGELVRGDSRLLVEYGKETLSFCSEEALEQFLLHPSDYRSHACLPARLTGPQRLGLPPKTLASIAEAARQRRMQQQQQETSSSSSSSSSGAAAGQAMEEEGLAELRDTLKDALTYIEVSTLDALTDALLFVGAARPLLPGGPQAAAARLLALRLRARNPLLPAPARAEAEKALANFVQGLLVPVYPLDADCETPFEARAAILQLHRHKAKAGQIYLPLETARAHEAKVAAEKLQQEWSHYAELQYARVTKRLDKLMGIE